MIKKKNKLILWLVSRCETDIKREEYAKTLNKYIPVDIYGKCNWTETLNQDHYDAGMNFWNLYKPYKFYFSFETTSCYDYITDKFFRALRYGLVPIVSGDINNYEKFAPKNSYINSNDFKSPQELANYLKYLDNNDNEYRKYFEWIHEYQFYEKKHWCELCRKLSDGQEPHKTYSNITDWWTHGKDNKLAYEI